MKQVKFFTTMLVMALFANSVMQSVMKQPTAAQQKLFSSGLQPILLQDDSASLLTFAQKNPTFDWTLLYNAPEAAQTPFSTAVWLGAESCVQTMLNPANQTSFPNILTTVNTPSSHGYTPLHYSASPPSHPQYKINNIPIKYYRDAAYKKIFELISPKILELISPLQTIFKNDDVTGLTTFAKNNPQFLWRVRYAGILPGETITPLDAAIKNGAINCLTLAQNDNGTLFPGFLYPLNSPNHRKKLINDAASTKNTAVINWLNTMIVKGEIAFQQYEPAS